MISGKGDQTKEFSELWLKPLKQKTTGTDRKHSEIIILKNNKNNIICRVVQARDENLE